MGLASEPTSVPGGGPATLLLTESEWGPDRVNVGLRCVCFCQLPVRAQAVRGFCLHVNHVPLHPSFLYFHRADLLYEDELEKLLEGRTGEGVCLVGVGAWWGWAPGWLAGWVGAPCWKPGWLARFFAYCGFCRMARAVRCRCLC